VRNVFLGTGSLGKRLQDLGDKFLVLDDTGFLKAAYQSGKFAFGKKMKSGTV